jgi:hypothetical protein
MIHDGRVYLDNTLAKSTHACTLQMVLRHVLHWNSRDQSSYLRAGSAMHEAQAAWNIWLLGESHEREAAKDAALKIFDTHYKPYADEFVPIDNRMHYANLATILDEWFTSRVGKLPWIVPDPRLIEVGFAYPLDAEGRIVGYGRLDLFARDRSDGSWVVVDHKSTGRLSSEWAEGWWLDSQISQYTWGALQHVPDLKGFYVNGIEFSMLPRTDRVRKDGKPYQCREHGTGYDECYRFHMNAQIVGPVARTPELLQRWQNDAIRAGEKYRYYATAYDPAEVGPTPDLSADEMEGPFTGACRFCTFNSWCRQGQHEHMLPALFVQDEWQPYDPREFEDSPVAEVINEAIEKA